MKKVKRIHLPKVPDVFGQDIIKVIKEGQDISAGDGNYLTQVSWKDAPANLQHWCTENICDSIRWGIQSLVADLPRHKDIGTECKFLYLIEDGGNNVFTRYYNDEGALISEYILQKKVWYIIDTQTFHDVTGLLPGQTRIAISGRIMP
jgi:hypothetical protein